MVKNQPSNAGDMGSIPGRETKTPHAAEQLLRRQVGWSGIPNKMLLNKIFLAFLFIYLFLTV